MYWVQVRQLKICLCGPIELVRGSALRSLAGLHLGFSGYLLLLLCRFDVATSVMGDHFRGVAECRCRYGSFKRQLKVSVGLHVGN